MDLFAEALVLFPHIKLPVVNDELYYFDAITAFNACEFFEQELYHVEGPLKGEKLVLQLWQEYAVSMIYGWKEKTFDKDGEWIKTKEQITKDLRKFREVFIFIPRKNAKSFMGAGFALKGLTADNEPGPKVVSAASDKEQAAEVYNMAKEIVEINPHFSEIQAYKKTMAIPSKNANYKVLSADVNNKHGKNLSTIVVDEVHALPNRNLVDVLFTSVGVRLQPLKIMLTTAGFDRLSYCYDQYSYAKKIQNGTFINEQFFQIIFEADEKDDWKDEATWKKANPNLGISITWDYFRGEFKKACEQPGYENTFKRLHLNMWTEQDVRWLPVEMWDACNEPAPSAEFLKKRDCFGGLDLSSKKDLTAWVLVFPLPENKFYVKAHFFMPIERVAERKIKDRVDYDDYIRKGLVQTTPGNSVDYDCILKKIKEDAAEYQIQKIGSDPWNAQDILPKIEALGLEPIEIAQNLGNLSNATKHLEAAIEAKQVIHGQNPVMRWMFGNVAIFRNSEEHIKFSKKKAKEKTDGMCALVNGIVMMLGQEEKKPSIYKTRGVRTAG